MPARPAPPLGPCAPVVLVPDRPDSSPGAAHRPVLAGLVLSLLALFLLTAVAPAEAQGQKPRARDLGVPFEGQSGPLNAITDVPGVEVGHVTLISGKGPLQKGKGPVRTGVTAVLPRGRADLTPVFAGFSTFNGNGEMAGAAFVDECGLMETPLLMTNTHSVGVARDAVLAWRAGVKGPDGDYPDPESWLPVVGETQDDALNDIMGFHVKREHVFQALDRAASGPVAEGGVGAGVGGITFMFKSGMGTSSRRLPADKGGYTVGVLVQSNFGWDSRDSLLVAGLPVGQEIPDLAPVLAEGPPVGRAIAGEGSLCAVVATDAPLLPHQLRRLAKRVALGMARVGSKAHNGSGEFFLAFSTANPEAGRTVGLRPVEMLPNQRIDPLFDAVVQATEEAIVNSLVAAETMEGVDGNTAYALPHDRLRTILKKYNRLVQPGK